MDNKLRVITSYEKLSEAIQEQIKLTYPRGYTNNLISFKNREGQLIKGLRFETDEKIYLIKMTIVQAENIMDQDDDFDDDGNLIAGAKAEYKEKYSDLDYISEDEGDSDDDMDVEDLPDESSSDMD